RTGARLERSATQDVRAGGANPAGDLVQDFVTLDGARTRDHAQTAAADLDLTDGDHRILTLKVATGQLEGLEDRQHLLDARNGRQRFGAHLVLVADDTDNGPHFALAEVRLEAQLLDVAQQVFELFGSRVGSENDNHWISPWSLRRAGGVSPPRKQT